MSLHTRGPVSENIKPDDATDTVEVYGNRVSGELLRTISEPSPEGRWFRIVKVENGVATVEMRILPPDAPRVNH